MPNEPPDIVVQARAKLAKPNYGMSKRNRELITKLCDEVEREDKDHRLTIDTFRQQERIWQQKFDEQDQANTALREQLAARTIELERESHEMQKWNNRANQLAIEGQELRQRLAQVEKERDHYKRLYEL